MYRDRPETHFSYKNTHYVSEWHEREDKALYGILELTLLSISGHWNGKVGG